MRQVTVCTPAEPSHLPCLKCARAPARTHLLSAKRLCVVVVARTPRLLARLLLLLLQLACNRRPSCMVAAPQCPRVVGFAQRPKEERERARRRGTRLMGVLWLARVNATQLDLVNAERAALAM